MLKVAVVLLADIELHSDWGRAVNALEAVKEFKDAGDDVQLIFDGAGTKWIVELSQPAHKYHELFTSVTDKITGACDYCANAFKVADKVKAAGISLMDEYDRHPSLRTLVVQGYQIITF